MAYTCNTGLLSSALTTMHLSCSFVPTKSFCFFFKFKGMAKLSLRLHICMGESSAKGSPPLVLVVGASFFFFWGGGGDFRVLHLRKCDL